MEKIITVKLLDQHMKLKVSDDQDLFKEVLALTEEKLLQAQTSVKKASAHQIAILALMNLAEDYIRAKNKVIEHQALIQDRAKVFFNQMDGV